MAEGEHIFLSENGMLVSVSRVVLGGTTYATSNLTSVTKRSIPASTGCSLLMIGFGLLCLLASLAAFTENAGQGFVMLLVAAAFFGGGILWLRSLKAEHKVVLSSSSGEVQALSSKDEQLIDRVIGAVSSAIIARG